MTDRPDQSAPRRNPVDRLFSVKSLQRALTVRRRPRSIFVPCFPKSGSTYLCKLLQTLTGYRVIKPVLAFAHNEQDLFEFRLKEHRHDAIIRLHTRATRNNLDICHRHRIKPVILVRNIFDIVPSMFDHIETEPALAMGFVHREYFDLDRQAKIDFIIRIILPWYFNFLMSWRQAEDEIETHWLSYEQLFADQVAAVSDILTFYGLPADEAEITAAIDQTGGQWTRKNVGKAGRGEMMLNEEHKADVRRLADAWGVRPKRFDLIGL